MGSARSRMAAALVLVLCSCGGGDDAGTIQPLPVEWTVEADSIGDALMITPRTALRGSSAYGVVATRRILDAAGTPFGPSPDFAATAGLALGDQGATILYSSDLESPENPYPDGRLVRGDGTIRVPDRFVLRGMPEVAAADTARAILRDGADRLETLAGYSTTAPIRIALSTAPDLASVDGDSLYLFERPDGELDLAGLLELAGSLGIDRDEIALAFSFPTQPIEDDLLAAQALLRERAAALEEPVELTDPDPDDDLPIGVFGPDDDEFAAVFAAAPDVGAVVAGLFSSPDFRGDDGIWVPARLTGETPAAENRLDFLLALPAAGAPPYPVVLLQHGFGGGNEIVLDLAQLLTSRGLAAIGIDAVSHGRRGNPLDLLRARPFVARDLFRQSIADQMTILRAIEAGIDVDGDGAADLDSDRMGYLGISLGGILGATLVAVEQILPTAVLNVAGGRVAFLGQAEGLRDLVQGELAAEVGLETDDPIFRTYIERVLESGQHAIDPVDGLNFARRWFLEPFPGSPPHNVLLQEGIGDLLVDNQSTEALAEAGGLTANTPMSDPDGVSALWRFAPPGGHGILGRDDVREQAVRFLASDGTEIIDPS